MSLLYNETLFLLVTIKTFFSYNDFGLSSRVHTGLVECSPPNVGEWVSLSEGDYNKLYNYKDDDVMSTK